MTDGWQERADREPARLDDADPTFAALRPKLFGIAHRVLGGSAEAEDVVQEAWLRWRASDRSAKRRSWMNESSIDSFL